ncbi:UTP--glucose-1-phosphate uridylyltransferase GalU [Metabacillus fastidiosus]|uniref:UTP--glucose-1-phosphate uridylyltransferase GalU n=1 Tax=Metabacillus fastidiosus TaxID=1458 RepID=UPI003D2AE967
MRIKKAIIPAAGLGTRMLPSTKAIPKEMLPIIDKPAIQYIVEEALAAGIKDIIIITGDGKQAIEAHFDSSFLLEQTLKKRGKLTILKEVQQINKLANIHYIRQGIPKGLGHAIWCARNFIGNEPFAVLLGDTLVKQKKLFLKEMVEYFEKYQSSVIGVKRVEQSEVERYGIVNVEESRKLFNEVINLVEKPKKEDTQSNLAILGRYILTPKIFELLEKQKPGVGNEIQLTDALQELLKYEKVYADVFEGETYDIGGKFGYFKAVVEYAIERENMKQEVLELLNKLVTKHNKIQE